VYGPENSFDDKNSHVLGALIKKIYKAYFDNDPSVTIWGTGKPRREFLHVDDLVDCMIWCPENIEKTTTFMNVGPGKDISIKKLAKMIANIIGYKGKFVYDTTKPDGMRKKCLDTSVLRKLGWSPKISLKNGVEKTIIYYKRKHAV